MASQVSKLNYVDGKLGAPSGGQQTTRVLFNTVLAPGTQRQIEFFSTFQGLTNGQTNLTTNKLDSNESMVVKTIWLAQYLSELTTSGQALDDNGFGLSNRSGLVLDFIVGNQKVIKDLPLNFNGGIGNPFDRLHANNGVGFPDTTFTGSGQLIQTALPTEIRLLTDIVIPPQVAFSVVIKGGPSTNFGTGVCVCSLSGYGKIFSAGSSF